MLQRIPLCLRRMMTVKLNFASYNQRVESRKVVPIDFQQSLT
jgi:hypothetical protein